MIVHLVCLRRLDHGKYFYEIYRRQGKALTLSYDDGVEQDIQLNIR